MGAMVPENPVVGGTVLRRAAIQSPNFVTTVSGWSINQDGSAEFNNIVIRNGQVISGTALFYSGTPAAGNLVASIAAAAGTDSKGNAYLAGITSYDPVLIAAVQLFTGAVTFYSAASEAGPWTAGGQLLDGVWTEPSATGLNFKVGAVPAQVQLAAALVTMSVPELISVAINSGVGLDILNANSSSGTLVRISVAASGNTWLSARVTGDAFVRLIFDTDGSGRTRMRAGTGAASATTQFYVNGLGGAWASADIAWDNSGTPESFHAVTFANGWTNSATGPNMQYRRTAAPDNCVQVVGRVLAPAGIVAGQAIIAALPAAYRPGTLQSLLATNVTTNGVVRLTVQTTGTISFAGGAVAGDNIEMPGGTLIALNS